MPAESQDHSAIPRLLALLSEDRARHLRCEHMPASASEWEGLADCADKQHVAPLLFACISEAAPQGLVPQPMMQRWQRAYHQNAARNLRLFHDLDAVLQRLEGAGYPVMVLKGAHLASAVYANPALRVIGDLDILVRAADVRPAMMLLKDLDYRPLLPPWINTPSHVGLVSPGAMAELEIHWELADPADYHRIPVGEIWDRSVPAHVSASPALALHPSDLLLHLAYHAVIKHLLEGGVRWLVDIDTTIRHNALHLDWDAIVSRAVAWGLDRALAIAMHMCQAYLHSPVPASVWGVLKWRPQSDLEAAALAQMAAHGGPRNIARGKLVQLQDHSSPREKVRFLVLSATELPRAPFHAPEERSVLLSLYYTMRRVLYVIGRYASTIGLLKEDQSRSAGKLVRALIPGRQTGSR